MPYKYIGRITNFQGKTLWEILGNLKNFGVDRVIARNRFQRYVEPCYIKIKKVEALPNCKASYDENRKVIALVEKTFRGIKQKQYVQLESASYKTDYFLVHKYEESKFSPFIEIPKMRILSSTMEFPPLLKQFIVHQTKIRSVKELKMKIQYNTTGLGKLYRAANEGEIPTELEPSIGLGQPMTLKLYQNIKE